MATRELLSDALPQATPSPEARIRELEAELAALRRDRERWRLIEELIDASPVTVYLKDAAYQYLAVNRDYERLSGHDRASILGRNDFDIFPDPVARLFREQDEEVVRRGEPVDFKETIPLPDGIHSFITQKFLLHTPEGKIAGIAGVCTDITELERARIDLERAQSELVKQERLAALAELSGVIAHEVRNPLGVIFNALATLKRILPTLPGDSRELLEIIDEEAARLNRLVSAVLELVRPVEPEMGPVAIDAIASQAIAAARSLADTKAEVRLEIAPDLPAIHADERMLLQALISLVTNAIQAPNRRGPIKVRISVEPRPSDMVRFEVEDDGSGVPTEVVDRIFSPFFTTRAAGTGLGLPIVKRVADAHRGTIELLRNTQRGATFVLRIPASSD